MGLLKNRQALVCAPDRRRGFGVHGLQLTLVPAAPQMRTGAQDPRLVWIIDVTVGQWAIWLIVAADPGCAGRAQFSNLRDAP